MRRFDEIIHFHMEANDYNAIIRACRNFGDKNPNLWIKVLSYFAGQEVSAEILLW